MAHSNLKICSMLTTIDHVAGDKLYDTFANWHGRRHVTKAEYGQRTQRFHENKRMIEVTCFCFLMIIIMPAALKYSAAVVPVFDALAFAVKCAHFIAGFMSLFLCFSPLAALHSCLPWPV